MKRKKQKNTAARKKKAPSPANATKRPDDERDATSPSGGQTDYGGFPDIDLKKNLGCG